MINSVPLGTQVKIGLIGKIGLIENWANWLKIQLIGSLWAKRANRINMDFLFMIV